MKLKNIITLVILIPLAWLIIAIIGYFTSGYVIFTGVYNPQILDAFSSLLNIIIAPTISLIAAILFYFSLQEQRNSISSSRVMYQKETYIKEFYTLLDEIKQFSANTKIYVSGHYSSHNQKLIESEELIEELYIFYQLHDHCLSMPQSITGTVNYVELFGAKVGEYVKWKNNSCIVKTRDVEEINKLKTIERKIALLFFSMFNILGKIEDNETYVNILASHLYKQYFEVVLQIFNKTNMHPKNEIIFQIIKIS